MRRLNKKRKISLPSYAARTGKVTEEAFAEAARGNSEDPATARNRRFSADKPFKKNENKPHGLYDRAVDMQTGRYSDIPIRYGGNWYILRRGESVPKTFAEAKPDLLVSLRNRHGYGARIQAGAEGQDAFTGNKGSAESRAGACRPGKHDPG